MDEHAEDELFERLEQIIFDYSDIEIRIHKKSQSSKLTMTFGSSNVRNISEYHKFTTLALALQGYMRDEIAEDKSKRNIYIIVLNKMIEDLLNESKRNDL